jgi:hypothetical protein
MVQTEVAAGAAEGDAESLGLGSANAPEAGKNVSIATAVRASPTRRIASVFQSTVADFV